MTILSHVYFCNFNTKYFFWTWKTFGWGSVTSLNLCKCLTHLRQLHRALYKWILSAVSGGKYGNPNINRCNPRPDSCDFTIAAWEMYRQKAIYTSLNRLRVFVQEPCAFTIFKED